MSEHDPTGRSSHEPGAKLDAGKPRPALVLGGFSRALEAVTEVGTFGAAKYTPDGWRSVPDGVERYSEAMMRHWLQDPAGLAPDADSGLAHAAHLAWNALARLELLLAEKRKHELGLMADEANRKSAERLSWQAEAEQKLRTLPASELIREALAGPRCMSTVGPFV